ncbi:MAG: type II toxin-antitoxin system PemK/MazF family toxin, partial [Ktedonobacterales bacterium]
MRRGEVWWARVPAPAKPRPVLLLSRDEAYLKRTHATVCPITRKSRGLRSEVRLSRADGMREGSIVNLDDIQT